MLFHALRVDSGGATLSEEGEGVAMCGRRGALRARLSVRFRLKIKERHITCTYY